MRRVIVYATLALALTSLFFAPLARFYVLPRVKKIPTDYSFRAVSVGTATYLDPGRGFAVVGPNRIEDVHIVRGDPARSSKDVAVWDSFDSTFDVDDHHQLDFSIDRYTFDRTTGVSVDCCGQNANRTGALTQLMPIGVKRITYSFWDSTAQRAFPLRFVGTTMVDGLPVYRYDQHVQPITLRSLAVPGDVVGQPSVPSVQVIWRYTADTHVWAEPVTGAIVKASQTADQWFADESGRRVLTVARTSVGQTPDTVRRIVDLVASQGRNLRLLELWIPAGAAVIGVALLLVALLLLSGVGPGGAPSSSPVASSGDMT